MSSLKRVEKSENKDKLIKFGKKKFILIIYQLILKKKY